MKHMGLKVVPIVTALFIAGCGDDSPIVERELDQALSGVWNGRVEIKRTGKCRVNGADYLSYPTGAEVTVELESRRLSGNVFIFDPCPISGTVGSGAMPQSVSFGTNYTWLQGLNEQLYCSQDTVNVSGWFTGTIIEDTSQYIMTVTGEEDWCPADSCTFDLTYILTKSK